MIVGYYVTVTGLYMDGGYGWMAFVFGIITMCYGIFLLIAKVIF